MRKILGVDGGGSKTYAVLVDELGNRLGQGVAGCGNHQGPGMDVAKENIQLAMSQALTEAGLEPEDITYVQYGLAGADRPYDFSIIRPALATLPYPRWDVVCDTYEGLRTGSPTNVGVVLVCGSGTNAVGRTQSGETAQTGGFGYLYGDTAGGQFLAEETFRAAVRSYEYREGPSLLPDMVSEALGFASMEEVYNHYLDNEIYHVPLHLTLLLHEAAARGDGLAIRILVDTGRELGNAANSVVQRLGGFGDEPFPVVLTGSVLQQGRSSYLLESLEREVRRKNKSAYFVIPEMAPVYGAIMLGMDHLGIRVTDDMLAQFISYGGYAQ